MSAEPRQPRERLPRIVRLALGATSRGIGDRPLRQAAAGRIVLITGASSGIGEATARRLGGAGATVLLVARTAEKLEQLAGEIAAGEGGGHAYAYPCDLSEPDQVAELAAKVLDDHGHVDIVVNNAGISIRRWVAESYDRFHDYERTIALNYLGPVRLMLELLPSMRARGEGHIINIATMGVDFPAMRWSAYISSKSAFETWLGGLAPEVRPDGIAVTSIHMQLVRSPMLGPFRMWNYVPAMSTEEAASMIARAIVERPRVIAPPFARIGGPVTRLFPGAIEAALSGYAASAQQGRTPLPVRLLARPTALATEAIGGMQTVASIGVVRPVRPDRAARAALHLRKLGLGVAGSTAAAAALHPEATAIVDERGTITFAALDERTRRLGSALRDEYGLEPGQRVGVLCRNHRGFVEAAAAVGRLGCDLVPLNTDFAGPQLGDVLRREGVAAAIHDAEFESLFEGADFDGARLTAWTDEQAPERPTIDALVERGDPDLPAPAQHGGLVMLTSGTTGTPKGAQRTISPLGAASLAVSGLLELARVRPAPRAGEPVAVAPPLFHLFGQIGLIMAFGLGSPLVIRRRFDPELLLADIERHRVGSLLAVPTMLARILKLPGQTRRGYDTSSLRFVVSGAAPLAPELALAFMDEFGEILFNGYASTEVGFGTLATPRDLRSAPGTVGRPAPGVRIRILDEIGQPVPRGETGRIFVGSPMLFDGYSGGGGKEVIDGLMSTGDVGHLDRRGRLFIEGRDDDMILSGGENVFPQEVEELLVSHDEITDAAVYGVPDADFGQRLAAQVVLREGATVDQDQLREFVRARLARYKVPREFHFVDRLPRTDTGKIRRGRLGELAPSDS